MKKWKNKGLLLLFVAAIIIGGMALRKKAQRTYDIKVPPFDGETYAITINHNKSYFRDEELRTDDALELLPLDALGRCRAAVACCSTQTLDFERQGRIADVRPSGWHTVRYDDLISDRYLYNRCHLCCFSACGGPVTNDARNLITGTRHFNADPDSGMLHYELQLTAYLKTSRYHVMYRVTPYFTEDHLVADGVLMEAKSVEDHGQSLEFCVFVYNEQPGITIDHRTGFSKRNAT